MSLSGTTSDEIASAALTSAARSNDPGSCPCRVVVLTVPTPHCVLTAGSRSLDGASMIATFAAAPHRA